MWFVYILHSPSTGRTYTGATTDPDRRLGQHNAGKGAKATRRGRPWQIGYLEAVGSKGDALRREATFKKLPRGQKLVLCGLA